MAQNIERNQRQILREQFELVSANVKAIIQKKPQSINYYQKQLLLNLLKKVIYIRQTFDTKAARFNKLSTSLQIQFHQTCDNVFKKGDKGDYFFIVLEGCYYIQNQNTKDKKKSKSIYYFPGDSFGEVSLIYDVPRGATITAQKASTLIKISKSAFNECGDVQKSIQYLNSFFENHSYFENEDKFMIRVVSSLSKLTRFEEKTVIIQEGDVFNEILFFVKGQANVYKSLKLQKDGHAFYENILITTLKSGDVFGERYYLTKQPSKIKIVSLYKGEYIKVAFKDNVSSIETPLYKRIRQNSLRFPTDDELIEQFKVFLMQKQKQLQFLKELYKKDKQIEEELKDVKIKINKLKNTKLSK